MVRCQLDSSIFKSVSLTFEEKRREKAFLTTPVYFFPSLSTGNKQMEWLPCDNSYLKKNKYTWQRKCLQKYWMHTINHCLHPTYSQAKWLVNPCIFSALYMIDQISGAINSSGSISVWQGDDRPVFVCSEWVIWGSWCWAVLWTVWQSAGISLSMAHDDNAVSWCDTLLGYCYRWMTLMCLTRTLSPPISICVPQRSSTLEEGRQMRPEPTHSQ